MNRIDRHELASALTHGVGILLSVAGGALLVTLAALTGDPWKIVGVSVFVAALVLLYSASTTYHAVCSEARKRRWKVIDHCAIYVLIAGTYTPFMLDAIRGPWGWSLFGVIWGLTLAGVVFKLCFTGAFPRLSTAIYIGMGWMILVAAGPLWSQLDLGTIGWLVAGGLAYTGGTVFYHSPKAHHHAVWHLFVIAGSLCHGVAVGLQVWA